MEPDTLDEHRGAERHRQLRAQGGRDKPDGKDDHALLAHKLLDEGAELVNGELADLVFAAVGPGTHKEDELGDDHGGHGGEGDTPLGGLDVPALSHGAAKEQVEAKGGRAHQAGELSD